MSYIIDIPKLDSPIDEGLKYVEHLFDLYAYANDELRKIRSINQRYNCPTQKGYISFTEFPSIAYSEYKKVNPVINDYEIVLNQLVDKLLDNAIKFHNNYCEKNNIKYYNKEYLTYLKKSSPKYFEYILKKENLQELPDGNYKVIGY